MAAEAESNTEQKKIEEAEQKEITPAQEKYSIKLKAADTAFKISTQWIPLVIHSFHGNGTKSDFNARCNFLFYFSALLGILVCFAIKSYKRSRKNLFYVSSLFSLVGWILMMFQTMEFFEFGRSFTGFAMGIHSVSQLYCLGECIYVEKMYARNYATHATYIDSYWGILRAILCGILLLYISPYCVIFCGALVQAFVMHYLRSDFPESPYILLRKMKDEQTDHEKFNHENRVVQEKNTYDKPVPQEENTGKNQLRIKLHIKIAFNENAVIRSRFTKKNQRIKN